MHKNPQPPTFGTLPELWADHDVDPDVGRARRTRPVFNEDKPDLELLGFNTRQVSAAGGAMLHPLYRPDNVTGDRPNSHVLQLPRPRRTSSGRLVEFEAPNNQPPLVDSNPTQAASLNDATRPLYVLLTGDPWTVDAAVSAGFTTVGLYGYVGQRSTALVHNAAALPTIVDQLAAVELDAREVRLVLRHGVNASTALNRLAAQLLKRGAVVSVHTLARWAAPHDFDNAFEDEAATAALYKPATRDSEIMEALLCALEPVNTTDGPAVLVGERVQLLDAPAAIDLILATAWEGAREVLSVKRAGRYRRLMAGMAASQPLPHELAPLRQFIDECGGAWAGTATELSEGVPELGSPVAVGRRLSTAMSDGALAEVGLWVSVTRPKGVTHYLIRHTAGADVSVAELVQQHGPKCHLCGLAVRLDVPAAHPLAAERDHLTPVGGGPRDFTDTAALRPAHRRCNASRGTDSVRAARDRMTTAQWRAELLARDHGAGA